MTRKKKKFLNNRRWRWLKKSMSNKVNKKIFNCSSKFLRWLVVLQKQNKSCQQSQWPSSHSSIFFIHFYFLLFSFQHSFTLSLSFFAVYSATVYGGLYAMLYYTPYIFILYPTTHYQTNGSAIRIRKQDFVNYVNSLFFL